MWYDFTSATDIPHITEHNSTLHSLLSLSPLTWKKIYSLVKTNHSGKEYKMLIFEHFQQQLVLKTLRNLESIICRQ